MPLFLFKSLCSKFSFCLGIINPLFELSYTTTYKVTLAVHFLSLPVLTMVPLI